MIRDATEEDVVGMSEVMPQAFGMISGAAWLDHDYIREGIESCNAGLSGGQRLRVLRDGGRVASAAFIGHGLADDGWTAHRAVGLIHGIATRSDRMRQGHGRELLGDCEEVLAGGGARVLLAEVRPQASGFFEVCGYRATEASMLAVPTATGDFTLPKSVWSTILMWKTLVDGVYITKHGSQLAGVRR